jgi:D-alanyl-D-alanine carboxypeptidase
MPASDLLSDASRCAQRPTRRPARERGRPSLLRAILSIAGTLSVGGAILALSATSPPPTAAVGPIPSCRLGNVMTYPRAYDDWRVTLVDWLLRVEKNYRPPDLVHVTDAGIAGGGYIRAVAIDDLRAMAKAAARNGTPIGVWSAYRSYRYQVEIFNGYVGFDGFNDAITYSQRPGHSEHQLGLAIDFMSAGGGSPLEGFWDTTPAGQWMVANAWKYGWVMSYPRGKGGSLWNEAACFHFEPWHYRYLGRELAAKVHRSGLTIREYLWKHFTRVDPVTGEPIPTPTPTPTPSPTPSPSPEISPTPLSSATTDSSAAPTAGGEAQDLNGIGLEVGIPIAAGIGLLALVPLALGVRRGWFRR